MLLSTAQAQDSVDMLQTQTPITIDPETQTLAASMLKAIQAAKSDSTKVSGAPACTPEQLQAMAEKWQCVKAGDPGCLYEGAGVGGCIGCVAKCNDYEPHEAAACGYACAGLDANMQPTVVQSQAGSVPMPQQKRYPGQGTGLPYAR